MRKKYIAVALLVFLGAAIPSAHALFFSMPVFDVTNFVNAVERYHQLQQQLSQLVRSYDQMVLEYKQMLWMAQRLPGLAKQKFISAPWRYSSASDTYGKTSSWVSAINEAASAADGYLQAVDPLGAYGAAFARMPADQIERAKTNYATVELADAANVHSIDILGRQRAKAKNAENAIKLLESLSLSEDKDMNTEIAVLNKINAADMMALRAGQETNQLLVSLLEQSVTSAKAQRDARTRAINIDIAYRLNAVDAGMSGVRDTTAAITSFVMP